MGTPMILVAEIDELFFKGVIFIDEFSEETFRAANICSQDQPPYEIASGIYIPLLSIARAA